MEDVDKRNNRLATVLEASVPFLQNEDTCSLRLLNSFFYTWSYRGTPLLQTAMNAPLEDDHVWDYWKCCLESRKCSTDYDDQYNRLRSYGYGETFMKNEGVIGDILRDINRTFPTHVLFRSSGGMGQIMLENVLRSLNEYFPDIGYCQGMNFVVGVVILGITDPHGWGFSADASKQESIVQRTMTLSQSQVERRTFALVVNFIQLLGMKGLWSAGIPELKRFIFILQRYMEELCPRVVAHFDRVGYDTSIIVSKWFMTLFAYTLPLTLLYRLWGTILCDGWVGVLRIALGLLRCFEPTLLRLDLVGLSLFMKDLRDRQLQTPAQRAQLLSSILGVSSVTECSFRALDEEYARVATRRATLDYTPRADRAELLRRQSAARRDVGKIRGQLERVSERELAAKERWREAAGAFRRAEEELEEQAEFKRQLLAQVETLFYNEQYAAQPASDEELARRAFLCQQDVNALTQRIARVGETMKQRRGEKEELERRLEEARRQWDEIRAEKSVYMEELMEAVKRQTELMK
ncbi:hypothetical protein WA588_006233 [Blastocystis sp. NMH]